MTTATGHPYTPIPAAFADAAGTTIADELAAYTVRLPDAEWRSIQADQKHGVTAELIQRRIAIGMTETPRV